MSRKPFLSFIYSGFADREGLGTRGPDPIHAGKQLVALGFLWDIGNVPLAKLIGL